MASEVDLCNLALAALGDTANVTSINPPDGSAQAALCWRFYPIARDALLELHTWGFATKRAALTVAADAPPSTWQYAYTPPPLVVNYLEVLDPESTDDYSIGVQMANTYPVLQANGVGVYSPQPFVIETDSAGNDILLTNQQDAVLRYTALIEDATKFSPLFNECLQWYLASKLAGPLLKGADGRAATQYCLGMLKTAFEKAAESDANQRRLKIQPGAPWMVNR